MKKKILAIALTLVFVVVAASSAMAATSANDCNHQWVDQGLFSQGYINRGAAGHGVLYYMSMYCPLCDSYDQRYSGESSFTLAHTPDVNNHCTGCYAYLG